MKDIADQLSPSCRQYTRVRRCGGRLKTCWLWTPALAPPPRFTTPMPTIMTCPSTSTLATTGDGGRPPPANIPDRPPPQLCGCTPITPDAFKRFTA